MSIVDNKLTTNSVSLIQDFESFLQERVSPKTLRNYRSDIKHFLSWLKSHYNILDGRNLFIYFSLDVFENYKTHQISQKYHSISTVNRRLSTLRNFAKFLASRKLISENTPALIKNIQNEAKTVSSGRDPEKILSSYKRHLSRQVSKTTLRNYLSDVRHFLTWIENQTITNNNNK